ncbi:MAG: methionine aminopeptidase [Piptocephalis tieghemiana]|nr:MAG: methionine aminopeptidase [Piptocephalis tieghemiana]
MYRLPRTFLPSFPLLRGFSTGPSSPRRQPRQPWSSLVLGNRSRMSFGQYDRLVPPSLREGVAHIPRVSLNPLLPRPSYAESGDPGTWSVETPRILDPEEQAKLGRASALAAKSLTYAHSLVQVGRTTEDLNALVHAFIIEHGAYPSPLNYMGFPKSICTSISNVVCHGIPDARPLQSGDIINIDITVYLDGYHGDTSDTYLVGEVDAPGKRLIDWTHRALESAISICKPGVPFSSIGKTVEDIAAQGGYTVNREFSGHGIGRDFHSLPLIYHHANDEPGIMEEGMVFTIEPMLCQGSAETITWPDGWTMATKDQGRSAQAEHTLRITPEGVSILTSPQ